MELTAINAALASFAKQSLAEVIASGLAPNVYDRYINGREGAPEESVQAPGPITYEFANWNLVINAVLAELKKRGPRSKSGRFAASYIVVVNGRLTTEFNAIPAKAEVIVTNAQPYIRKAEAGLLGVPRRRLFDGTKRSMAGRFGAAFKFETVFLNIGSGVHPLIPYILKGSQGRRKDRQAGMPITYPSILINAG